jgi:hypothetical protein
MTATNVRDRPDAEDLTSPTAQNRAAQPTL